MEVKSDQITIYKWIYDESIKKGKEDLYQYYLSKEHKIEREEISLGKIKFDIIEQENNTVQSHPLVDYPYNKSLQNFKSNVGFILILLYEGKKKI